MAANQSIPWTIALDADNLYWVNVGPQPGLYKVAKAGGPRTTLYEGPVDSAEALPLDETSIYLTNAGAILAIPLAGGPPRTVASDVGARSVAVANGNLYWLSGGGDPRVASVIKRIPVAGGTPTTFPVPEQTPRLGSVRFARSSTDGIYFSLAPGGGILRVDLAAASPTMLVLQEVRDMGFNGDTIFFSGRDSIASIAKSGGKQADLTRSAITPFGVAVDDASVYFTDASPNGGVFKIAKGGGPVTTLAERQETPHAIAVDATHVYWNSIDERAIKRIAK